MTHSPDSRSAETIPAIRSPVKAVCRLGGVLAVALLLAGCSASQWPVLHPDGPIAATERTLLFTAFGLMLIVVVPVWVLTVIVLVRFRASRNSDDYHPNWQSNTVDAIVWIGPAIIVMAIGSLVWDYTHKLDPYKPIASDNPPLEIQVVAQDWKWLFVYPDADVAVVNELVLPVDRPVTFKITSDTVMNSFYIPGLAGQIYAMAGMQSQLNVLAVKPGTFTGRNAQYSGAGFSDQQFAVKAVSEDDYQAWLETVRQSPDRLNAKAYAELAKPSEKVPVKYYAGAKEGLFDSIIEKYASHYFHDRETDTN